MDYFEDFEMKARNLALLMLMIFPHTVTWGALIGNKFITYAGMAFTLLGCGWYFYLGGLNKS